MSGPFGIINRETASPMYEQLAAILSGKIAAGELAVGQRLPTELDFARSYTVSRDTVRQAIAILERQGLVSRRRAKGTFVAATRVTQDLAELRSFRGGLIDRGVVPEMQLLEFRPVTTPKALAGAFGHREVMWLRRRYLVAGKPFATAEIYLHPKGRAIPWDVAERHDTYTICERFLKTPVARASATIRADIAGRSTAKLLDLRPSSPVLVVMQTHYAASGEALVCSSLRVRGDAYEFHIDLPSGVALQDGLTDATAAGYSQMET